MILRSLLGHAGCREGGPRRGAAGSSRREGEGDRERAGEGKIRGQPQVEKAKQREKSTGPRAAAGPSRAPRTHAPKVPILIYVPSNFFRENFRENENGLRNFRENSFREKKIAKMFFGKCLKVEQGLTKGPQLFFTNRDR